MSRPLHALIISTLLLGGLQAGQVSAQELPPPAPQPDIQVPRPKPKSQTARPKPVPPRVKPQPSDGSTPDVIILPAPATGEPSGTAPYQAPATPPATPDQTTPQTPNDSGVIIETEPTPNTTPTVRPTPLAHRLVSVGGASVTGLNDVDALRKLGRALAPKLDAKVILSDGQRQYTVTRAQLGATIPMLKLLREAQRAGGNVPVRFNIDLAKAQRAMIRLAAAINRPVRPISLDAENGHVVLSGGDGLKLSVTGSAQRVKHAIEAQPPRAQAALVVARTPGSHAASEATVRQMRYVLASFATPYDGSIRGRTHNLRIAARNINGTIVPDGEIFSANRAIGRRDAADGWQEAKMFVSGQVVSGVGAGICQCASTLYNAALLANLPIVERHPHMFRVSYAPPSRDATLYWGSKDFRFRNNTGGPLYVQTFLSDGRFHVRLYGTQPVRDKITIEAHTLSHREGTQSVAYRVIQSAAGTQRELLSHDSYRPHP